MAPSTAIAAQGYAAHASNGGIEAVDELPAAIRTQPLELDKLCTVQFSVVLCNLDVAWGKWYLP